MPQRLVKKRLRRVGQRCFAEKESGFRDVFLIAKQFGSAVFCPESPAF